MGFIDLHCDTLGILMGESYAPDYAAQATPELLRQGGAALQCFAAFTAPDLGPNGWKKRLTALFTAYDRLLAENEDFFAVRTKHDVDRALSGEGIGALLTVEGLHPFEGMDDVRSAFERGVRLMTFTWNNSNCFAAGVGDDPEKGLSEKGVELLDYMERVGIVPDVSHLNDGGFWDVVSLANKPFIASHSCSRALTPHRRNLTDEQLRALADKGGIVGINYCRAFLTEGDEATVDDVVRHLRHIVDVGGEELPALGSDFDGIGPAPVGLENAAVMHNVVDKLREAGFSASLCDRIYCRNAARVLRGLLPD